MDAISAQIDKQPLVVAIMGPTASGKSALSMRLAREFGAEIISADLAQVYRQVSVGTAKPSWEEREEIPHHLIDIRDLGEGFCLADFQALATQKVQEIWSRGHLPLVVGGTGLYVRGLLEGYSLEAPPPDMALREKLNNLELPVLLAELERLDPATFSDIDRCNKRRVSRALEVVLQTGRSFKECSRRRPQPWRIVKLGLEMERDALRERIKLRLKHMMECDWVGEVAKLLEQGWQESLQAANILGYSHVISFVKGQIAREQMEENIFLETCRFAKRQRTWLRAEPGLVRLAEAEERWEKACRTIEAMLNPMSVS